MGNMWENGAVWIFGRPSPIDEAGTRRVVGSLLRSVTQWLPRPTRGMQDTESLMDEPNVSEGHVIAVAKIRGKRRECTELDELVDVWSNAIPFT